MKQFIDRSMLRVLLILPALLLSPVSFGQEVLSLEKAISIALKQNYNIQIAANNLKKSEVNHHIGNADMLPNVSTSASYNSGRAGVTQEAFTGDEVTIDNAKSLNSSIGLNAQQTLFDGFRMFKVYNKLGKTVDLSNLKLKEEVENMTAQVISAYYEVVTAHELLELTQKSINVTNEQYLLTKKSQEFGRATLIDLLNIEVSLAQDSTNLLNAQYSIEQTTNYLSFLLGGMDLSNLSFDKEITVKEELAANLMAFNTNGNVLIQQAEINMDITELDYQIYKSSMLPQVFANVGYNLSNSQSDFGFANSTNSNSLNFGLTASWSLFQGFKRRLQLKTAQFDQLNQIVTKDQVTLNLNNDLKNAKTAFIGARNKVALQERNLVIYQKQYDVTKQLQELGKRTMLELTQTQQQLFQAKNNLFLAQKDMKIQEIEILRLSGKLVQ